MSRQNVKMTLAPKAEGRGGAWASFEGSVPPDLPGAPAAPGKGFPAVVLLVLGLAGAGKTSFLNAVVNMALGFGFHGPQRASMVAQPPRDKLDAHRTVAYRIPAPGHAPHAGTLDLVDTPGVVPDGDGAEAAHRRACFREFLRDGPVREANAVVLVVSAEDAVAAADFQDAFERLCSALAEALILAGSDLVRRLVFAVTHADALAGPSARAAVAETLREVLAELLPRPLAAEQGGGGGGGGPEVLFFNNTVLQTGLWDPEASLDTSHVRWNSNSAAHAALVRYGASQAAVPLDAATLAAAEGVWGLADAARRVVEARTEAAAAHAAAQAAARVLGEWQAEADRTSGHTTEVAEARERRKEGRRRLSGMIPRRRPSSATAPAPAPRVNQDLLLKHEVATAETRRAKGKEEKARRLEQESQARLEGRQRELRGVVDAVVANSALGMHALKLALATVDEAEKQVLADVLDAEVAGTSSGEAAPGAAAAASAATEGAEVAVGAEGAATAAAAAGDKGNKGARAALVGAA